MTDHIAVPGPFALHHLREVRLHTSLAGGDLVAVHFGFDEGFLSVEVDPRHDEVDVSFNALAEPSPLRHRPDALRHDVRPDRLGAGAYRDVLGLSSTWRWLLVNQQGYRDAFQIEFGPAGAEVTLQYLALASALQPRRVTAMTPR